MGGGGCGAGCGPGWAGNVSIDVSAVAHYRVTDELGVDKNTTVVFPAPLMSTIQELGNFLAREQAAATPPQPPAPAPAAVPAAPAPTTVDQGANGAPAAGRD